MIYNKIGDNMKLNNKGFTLVELLTVMVILVTILLIAIPSITSSLSRSEDKQMDAKKQAIIADVNINLKRSSFASGQYDIFKAGNCGIEVSKLAAKGLTSEVYTKNKKNENNNWCLKYISNQYVIEESNCSSECGLS